MSGAYSYTTLRRALISWSAAGAIFAAPLLVAQPASAGESYPPGAVSLVADPVDCIDNILSGYVDGAEPGTTVTFEIVMELGDGSEEIITLYVDADENGFASYSTEFIEGAESAIVTSQGQEIDSLSPFEVSVEVDLTKCDDDDDDDDDDGDDDNEVGGDGGNSGGGGQVGGDGGSLAGVGSNSQPWLQLGSMITALGAILVIAAARWRRQRAATIR